MEEYEVIRIPVSDGTEKEFAIMDTFTVEEKHYMAVSLIAEDEIQEGVYLYRYRDAEDGDIVVEQITEPAEYKRVLKEDKYYDVLAEIPRVRKDFGYPPLVTPSSQIVGTQAVMNIIMGERYKTFPKESRAMLKGEYGKLPGEVNEEVRAKAGIAPEDVITCRPADLLEPELEKYKAEYKDIAKSEEDVLSLALFPQVAPKFIEKRDHPVAEAAPAAAPAAPAKSADPNAVRELYVEWKG